MIQSLEVFPKSSPKSSLSQGKSCRERFLETNYGNGHANFLYVYFLFSYYIGFVPFRFRYDQHQSTFTVQSWYPQKIICAIIHATVLLRYALEIKKVHFGLQPADPIAYFSLIERCSSFLTKMIAFHQFWKKQDVFFNIIKILGKSSFPAYNPYKIQTTLFLSSICIFYIVMSVVRLIYDNAIIDSSSTGNKSWYQGLIVESKYYYLNFNRESDKTISPSVFEYSMAVFTGINIQFRVIAGFYLDLGVLICVLSLWSPVVSYINTLNSSSKSLKLVEFLFNGKNDDEIKNEAMIKLDNEMVMQQFKQLKRLSVLICEGIGDFLLPAISEVAFGYAIDFEEAILTTDQMRRLTIFLFYALTTSTLVFAAEVCRKISCVKTWICLNENDLKISRNELMMTLDSISHDEICINAGGRFIVNYSFVGTMIVVLVTFFIIRLQSEMPNSTRNAISGN